MKIQEPTLVFCTALSIINLLVSLTAFRLSKQRLKPINESATKQVMKFTWLCSERPVRLSRSDPVVQQTLIHSFILRCHVCNKEWGSRDVEAARRGDRDCVEKPGDVWGGASSHGAGKTSRGARRDHLVTKTLYDRRRFCGRETIISPSSNKFLPKPVFIFRFLTENIHSVVVADHGPSLRLNRAAVRPFIAPCRPNKDQIVVPALVRRAEFDLLTVLKPLGCRRGTPRHDALQRHRLRELHRNARRPDGINYLNWGGGRVQIWTAGEKKRWKTRGSLKNFCNYKVNDIRLTSDRQLCAVRLNHGVSGNGVDRATFIHALVLRWSREDLQVSRRKH